MKTRNMWIHTVMTIACAPHRWTSRMIPKGTCSRRSRMSTNAYSTVGR